MGWVLGKEGEGLKRKEKGEEWTRKTGEERSVAEGEGLGREREERESENGLSE